MATVADITIARGWTYVLLLPQFESNGTAPRDVTGSTFELDIRSAGQTVALPSVTVDDAVGGEISVKLSHTFTATLPQVGIPARYALTEILPNGDHILRLSGRVLFADPIA